VQPELVGHPDEVFGTGVGVADDHPAHRAPDDVVEFGLDHLAGQLAVRERTVHAIAHAALLDGDERLGVLLEHPAHGLASVEGLLAHHLERWVAEDHGSVGGDRPEPVVTFPRQVEQVRDVVHAVW
jgi:hypothetical protein